MHRSGVYITGIPLIENAPVGEGFARHVRNPGVIAQLDQRRTRRRGGEGLRKGRLQLMGGFQRLACTRVPDALEHLAKALQARVYVSLIECPNSLTRTVVQRPYHQPASRSGTLL